MQRVLTLLALGICANALVGLSTSAQTAPEITLTRLDCGTPRATPEDVSVRFSDTAAFGGLKMSVCVQLLPHQARRRLLAVGYRPIHERRSRSAEGEPGGSAGAAEAQARADQVCRHQPLSRRSHRSGRLVSAVDAADRQGRLGRADEPEAADRREPDAVCALDQRRRQGRSRAARQGRVRRRHASSC